MPTTQPVKDASEVGVHCKICQALDFLPFTCPACSSSFCKAHASAAVPQNHDCSASAAVTTSETSDAATSSVTFKSLLPDRSRQTDASPTPEELEKQAKKEAALAVLKKNFPGTTSQSSSASANKLPTKAPSKAVLLMKLKRHAKPADPRKGDKQVQPADRRYLVVRDIVSGKQADVWLSKDCSCGKALDLLANLLQVPNRNDVTGTPASELLHLAKGTDPKIVLLANSDKLATATADGEEIHMIRGG